MKLASPVLTALKANVANGFGHYPERSDGEKAKTFQNVAKSLARLFENVHTS